MVYQKKSSDDVKFTTVEKYLLGTWAIIVLLVLIVLAVFAFINFKIQQGKVTVKDIQRTLDETVNPCEDFYAYVCNTYIKENFQSYNDVPHIDNFNIINDEIAKTLTKILKAENEKSHTVHINKDLQFLKQSTKINIQDLNMLSNSNTVKRSTKVTSLAKTYYKSCINEDENKMLVMQQLKELGDWPVLQGEAWNESDISWTNLMYSFRKLGFATSTFINFDVVPQLDDSNSYVVQLSPPILFGIDKAYLLQPGKSSCVDTYFRLMIDIAVTLGGNKSEAEEQLKKSLEVEKEIAHMSDFSKDPKLVSNTSISDLEEEYKDIPWLEFINKLLPEGIALERSDTVYIINKDYFRKLGELLNHTNIRVQANFAFWRAILEKITYFPENIYKIYQDAYKVIDTGTAADKERCTLETYQRLPYALNWMYDNYMNVNKSNKLAEIIKYLKIAAGEIIFDLDWMDGDTKIKAIGKLDKMEISFNYNNEEILEKYYENLELNPNEFYSNSLKIFIHTVDSHYRKLLDNKDNEYRIKEGEVVKASATYFPTDNRIFISPVMLQPPFFSESFPMYVHFGLLGSIIGHEIIHGFDSIGSMYDENGNFLPWWTESTKSNFNNSLQCLIDQYNNYSLFDIAINGSSTANENIADSGGIKLAYSAYHNWLKDHQEETLGTLNYSPRQWFWISAAKNWCALSSEKYIRHLLATDKHPPNKFRVIGPFSNSQEFAAAFNCAKGSRMNPESKCFKWEGVSSNRLFEAPRKSVI